MPDVMMDLETLGTRPGCVILSIGAVQFDRVRGTVDESQGFYTVISRDASAAWGLKEDPATLAWWGKQSEAARAIFAQVEDAAAPLPIDALTEFNTWLSQIGAKSEVRVWGNGSDFDNVILLAVYHAMNLEPAWGAFNNRCYRTRVAEALHLKRERRGTHHHALDDAITQAHHLLAVDREVGYAYAERSST